MKKIFYFFLVVFACSSCNNNNENSVICPGIFLSVNLLVQYDDETPVVLDSYKVMWGDKDITPNASDGGSFEESEKFASYPIANDLFKKEIYRQSITVTFYGYLNGKEVIKEDYKIAGGDCHVYYDDTKPLLITLMK